MAFVWFSFLVSITLLILIGRNNIWLGLLLASFILGILNLPFVDVAKLFFSTCTDYSILMLALSVGIIPLIGGALERSGLIKNLIQSLNMRSKTFLFIAPAFMGMLSMPGGALLSAPVIASVGKGASKADYVAINVWFRHILVMIYPLAGLLATTKMAQLDLYTEVLYLLPGFLLLTLLGYFYLLRPIADKTSLEGKHSWENILKPICIILTAPVIHLVSIALFKNVMGEIPLIIGVLASLGLSFYFGKLPLKDITPIVVKMRPWRFSLLIIGMFIFLNIFKASDVSAAIAAIAFSKTFLIVGIGIFLGFVTGRVQVPVSIILPIFYARFGAAGMTPMVFAVMYFAVFIGYVVSPVHPCVSVTIEYFQSNLKEYYQKVFRPGILAIASVVLFSIIFIG
ncbi:MAG TPA: hypothetical protein DHW42_06465 [Candidatus Marinimicrobia bacterium]|nr:hypothetical protein [Candidatus Neomarinimicrobiota bacterium]